MKKHKRLQLVAIASELNIANNVEFCLPFKNIQNVYFKRFNVIKYI